MNIYVGNLSQEVSEDDLRQAFEKFGTVDTVSIIKDKYSNQSKGFGFVEMSSKEEGLAAIEGVNGTELKGKPLTVNEARPRTENRGGRGGGRGGFGGGGNRGGQGGGRGGGYGGGGNRGGYGGGGSRGGGNRSGSGNRGGQGRGN